MQNSSSPIVPPEIARLIGHNPDAHECLRRWGVYLRHCDDAIDKPDFSAQHLIRTLAAGNALYSCPFFRRHAIELRLPVISTTMIWGVSNRWERSEELWQRQWADVLRNADVFFVACVVTLTSGWDVALSFCRSMLAMAYIGHKDRHSSPYEHERRNDRRDPGLLSQGVREQPGRL